MSVHPPAFAKLLRRLRLSRGLTQNELAAAAKCSDATIQSIEQGVSQSWTTRTSKSLADALRATVPFTEEEAAEFAAASGLSPEMLRGPGLPAAILRRVTKEALQGKDTVALSGARESFARLLQVADPDFVRGLLDAAYIMATEPPALTAAEPQTTRGPRALVRQSEEDGHRVTEYAPVRPSISTPRTVQPPPAPMPKPAEGFTPSTARPRTRP